MPSMPKPMLGARARVPSDPARKTRTSVSLRPSLTSEAHLIALPDNPYPTDERVEVSAGKTPYVRFDLVCGEQQYVE